MYGTPTHVRKTATQQEDARELVFVNTLHLIHSVKKYVQDVEMFHRRVESLHSSCVLCVSLKGTVHKD